jgi:hypothetical protein
MLAKLLSAKVVAIAATAILGVAGAAAATGELPSQAQTTVSNALSHVDISVPKHGNSSSHGPGGGHGKSASHKADSQGANPNADFGHCTAFLAHHTTTSSTVPSDGSTTFSALIAGHGGTVASTIDYCKTVVAAHKPDDSQATTQSTEKADTTETSEPPEADKSGTTEKPDDTGTDGAGKPSVPGKSGSTAPTTTLSGDSQSTGSHDGSGLGD